MEYKFENLADIHRSAVIDIFNYYIVNQDVKLQLGYVGGETSNGSSSDGTTP